MSIQLIVDPGTPPCSWEEFVRTKPPFSIGLDGYISAGPRYDLTGPWLNFNHHEDCDRLATRATCGQVLMAIKQGLFDCLKQGGLPYANVYVNDCDEDVCMSWFLLRHWSMVEKHAYLKLTRLVGITDTLDSTAGAFPYPKDLPVLQDMAWIYQPYRDFRLSGGLDKKDPEAFRTIIEAVEDRIILYITGQGEQVPLDTRYEVLHAEPTWSMVQEIGAQAKTGLHGDGIKAYVSVRERAHSPGTYTYTIGRLSPFILSFDIPLMFEHLNAEEGLLNSPDRWGGGNTIGGSPRVAGSKLKPEQVLQVIRRVVEQTTP